MQLEILARQSGVKRKGVPSRLCSRCLPLALRKPMSLLVLTDYSVLLAVSVDDETGLLFKPFFL